MHIQKTPSVREQIIDNLQPGFSDSADGVDSMTKNQLWLSRNDGQDNFGDVHSTAKKVI